MMKQHSFITPFLVFIPEYLGFIDKDSVSAHVQIVGDNEYIVKPNKIWQSRYTSLNGFEWSKVFDKNGNNVTVYDTDALETSSFSVPIEIWDLIEGYFYLTFTVYKDWNSISYHTENHLFKKSDKLIWTRESYKKGF